jgi:hypothetical protein
MPLLFISHKHSDRQIAEVLARFIEERSAARIKVHLSSSPDFQGPRFGKALNAQLREALWKSEALILVYTSADQDWSYCMWECGMASHPQSPNTTVIVLQCGADVPSSFQDVLRANPRNVEDLKRLVDQLLRDPKLFSGGAIAPDFKDALVESLARDLHARLAQVLPPAPDSQAEQWPAWPYLRLELPRSEADNVEKAIESDRARIAPKIVSDHAIVVGSDPRAAYLFGKQSLPGKVKFSELLATWKDTYPDADAAWFDSCCEQIMICALRGFPVIGWATMREIGGDSCYTPIVTRARRLPFAGTVQFDLYFCNLSDPRAVPVASRMTPIDKVFHRRLNEINPQTLRLKDLVQDLAINQRNRLPILSADGAPLYIIHRSFIEQFIVKALLQNDPTKDPSALTLAELLADPEMKPRFEKSFAVIKRQSTLAEARAAMIAREGCSDVFVTDAGTPQEPVQGLLTNAKIARIG